MSLAPSQIQQLSDAFKLIDHDKDGRITQYDLSSLGMSHPLDKPVDLPMFLNIMTERLVQFDPQHDLVDAFLCFDDTDSGLVKVDELRKWLADVGDRMDHKEIDSILSGPFTDRHGNFNYREWIKVLGMTEHDNGASVL